MCNVFDCKLPSNCFLILVLLTSVSSRIASVEYKEKENWNYFWASSTVVLVF